MFKFNVPLTIVLSSGSLILLAIGSLLLVSNTAYTSHIQVETNANEARSRIDQQLPDLGLSSATDSPKNHAPSSSSSLITGDEVFENSSSDSVRNSSVDSRRRSGRMYGGNPSNYGNQQGSSIDNYAAAYGAAGSPSSQDSANLLSSSTVGANDASSFASFGEPPPSANSSPSQSAIQNPQSAVRQLQGADYAPHTNYYAGYMSPSYSSASYSSQQELGGGVSNAAGNGNYHHSSPAQHHYGSSPAHLYHKTAGSSPPLGYPTNSYTDTARYSPLPTSYYERHTPYLGAASTPLWASSVSGPTSGGFMSSATNALSHWTGGFGISEIICSIVAIAIGAIILGAPFFLIYLALMGNFSGSGTLNLTNPTSGTLVSPAGGAATTVNGRRKRLAIFEQLSSSLNEHQRRHSSELVGTFADSIVNQLSPFVDLQQVTTTFKRLVDSIEKFSHLKPEESKKRKEKNS